MKIIFVWLLCSISLCIGNNLLCLSFDKRTNTLRYFCDKNFSDIPFVNCLKESFTPIDSTKVFKLKTGACDRDVIAIAIKTYQNVYSFEFSFSHYKSSIELASQNMSLDFLNMELERLKQINGSYNELTRMPRALFKECPELMEIDYSHNKLEFIDVDDLNGFPKLKNIYLSHNQIRTLSSENFSHLINLEFLDLSQNQIQYFWTNVFRFNSRLQTLHFEFNPIEYFNCGDFFKLINASVFLPWAEMRILILTFCDDLNFDIVLNSGQHGFIATSKGKYEIHCGEQSFEKLTYFSIAPNQIKHVNQLLQCFSFSLEDISLDGTTLEKLNFITFRPFVNLKRLSLKNTHLADFDFSLLINQKQLYELDISNNYLKSLHNILLSQFSANLSRFIAPGNQFANVSDTIQQLTPSITELDLSGSFFGSVNATTFARFKHLMTLKLRNTNLEIFPSTNPFEQLQDLSDLDVSNNNFEMTNFKLLSPTLNKLKVLRIANCNIRNVLNLTQLLGTNLEVLDLSGNFLAALNADTFRTIGNLESLFLDNAYITHFDWNALQQQTKLLELRITNNNNLNGIDIGVVSKSLKWLNLESNELMEIKHLTREHFPNLDNLRVSNNRLSCVYLMQITSEWMDKISNFDLWEQKHKQNCEQINNMTTKQKV